MGTRYTGVLLHQLVAGTIKASRNHALVSSTIAASAVKPAAPAASTLPYICGNCRQDLRQRFRLRLTRGFSTSTKCQEGDADGEDTSLIDEVYPPRLHISRKRKRKRRPKKPENTPKEPTYELRSIKLSPPKPPEIVQSLEEEEGALVPEDKPTAEDEARASIVNSGPLAPELKHLIITSITTFPQLLRQSEVASLPSLDDPDLLVNHPALKHNPDLWRTLFTFRRRLYGDPGIMHIFRGARLRNVNMPTIPGPNSDKIWDMLYTAALRNPEYYEEVLSYAHWLSETHDKRWKGTYTRIMSHVLTTAPQHAVKRHNELIREGHYPSEGWRQFFVDVSSKILKLPTLQKRAGFERLRQVHGNVVDPTGCYAALIPFLGANATMTETYKWHKTCLKHGDIPQDSTPANSIFEYRGMTGSMEEIRALIDNLQDKGVKIMEESLCVLIRNRELKEDVLVFLVERLEKGSVDRALFGEKFWATVLLAKDLNVQTMVRFMGHVGIQQLGKEPVKALVKRLEGQRDAVEWHVGDMKAIGIFVPDEALHEAWDEWEREQVGESILEESGYPKAAAASPEGKLDEKHFDNLLVNHLRRHDVPSALHVITEMCAFSVPIKSSTLAYVLRVILRPRLRGHSPQTNPLHFTGKDDIGLAVRVLMSCVRSGLWVPPSLWREVLKRLGMERRLEDLERLSGWLVEWYHPVRGFLTAQSFGVGTGGKLDSGKLGNETGGSGAILNLSASDSSTSSLLPTGTSKLPQPPLPGLFADTPPPVRLPFDDPKEPFPFPQNPGPQPQDPSMLSQHHPLPNNHPLRYIPPSIRADHRRNPLRQLFPDSFIRAITEWGFLGIHRRPATLPLPRLFSSPHSPYPPPRPLLPPPRQLKITQIPNVPKGSKKTPADGQPTFNTDITWGLRFATHLARLGVHVEERVVARAVVVRLRAIYGQVKPNEMRSNLNRRVREVVGSMFESVEEAIEFIERAWQEARIAAAGGRDKYEESGIVGQHGIRKGKLLAPAKGRRGWLYRGVVRGPDWTLGREGARDAKDGRMQNGRLRVVGIEGGPGELLYVGRRKVIKGGWEKPGGWGRRLTRNEVRRIRRLKVEEMRRRMEGDRSRWGPGGAGGTNQWETVTTWGGREWAKQRVVQEGEQSEQSESVPSGWTGNGVAAGSGSLARPHAGYQRDSYRESTLERARDNEGDDYDDDYNDHEDYDRR